MFTFPRGPDEFRDSTRTKKVSVVTAGLMTPVHNPLPSDRTISVAG